MRIIRTITYVIILSIMFFPPAKSVEIANLEPIQAVWLHQDGENIFLETDTKNFGYGRSVDEALTNMKQNSVGVIYLDTAQFLFVTQSSQNIIKEMKPYIKNKVLICIWDGNGDVAEAAKYADSHKIGVKICKWKPGLILPELPSKIYKE